MHAYDLERKVRIVGPRLILLTTEATNLPRYETIDANRFSRLLKEDSDGKHPAYPLGSNQLHDYPYDHVD